MSDTGERLNDGAYKDGFLAGAEAVRAALTEEFAPARPEHRFADRLSGIVDQVLADFEAGQPGGSDG